MYKIIYTTGEDFIGIPTKNGALTFQSMEEALERVEEINTSELGYTVKAVPAHKSFITVTSGMSGYFAVLMQWNEGGFYEPWNTGFGRYSERAGAVSEAMQWALDEELEYRA